MVKKSSILDKLKDRLRSGSGVHVDTKSRNGGNASPSSRTHAAPVANDEVEELQAESRLAPLAREHRSARKMSDRESAALAMGDGFKELSSLLRGLQTRMDASTNGMAGVGDALRSLPAVTQGQLEMLRTLASQMERQNALGETMAKGLSDLPNVMKDVRTALDRAAATDERTSRTLGEFQNTMGRIHDSMSQMVEREDPSSEHMRKAVEEAGQRQEKVMGQLQNATDQNLAALRRAHEDQSTRLQKVVEDHGKWNQALLVLLGLVVLGLGAVLVVLLTR